MKNIHNNAIRNGLNIKYIIKNKIIILGSKIKFNIFFFSILSFIFALSIEKRLKLRKLDFSSNIIITITDSGNHQILSEDFQYSPDSILINGNEIASNTKSYYFSEKNNIIKLIWNSQITNCSSMFSDCENITSNVLSLLSIKIIKYN